MSDKYKKPFSHPRWNNTAMPRRVRKSDCDPELFKRVQKILLEGIKKGTVTQEDYDEFMNN